MPSAAGRRSIARPFITPSTSSGPGLVAIAAAGPVLLASAYVLTALLPASPLWNAVTRVLPAGLLLLALHPSLPTGVWWRRSLLLGALNFAGFFALQAFSLHRIPGGVAATIAALQTLLVPLGATALLRERLRWPQLAAAGAGVLGIALLVLHSTEQLDPPGVAAASLLAICAAAGMLLTRRWGLPPGVHHTTATAWQMLAGGILLLPAAGFFEGMPPGMTAVGWSVTAWMAAGGTALAFAIIFGAMHHGLAPVSVSRLMLLCPLVATAAGWIAYRQSLTPLQLLGAALVLTSIATVCRPPTLAPAPPTTIQLRIPAPCGTALLVDTSSFAVQAAASSSQPTSGQRVKARPAMRLGRHNGARRRTHLSVSMPAAVAPSHTAHYTPRAARAGVRLVTAAGVLMACALIGTVVTPPHLNRAVPFVWAAAYVLGVAGLVALALSGLLTAAIRFAWNHIRRHRSL